MGELLVSKQIVNLPIDLIKPNPYQPRKYFSDMSLEELSQSIKNYGLLQPISVRKISENHYELIAGERRLRASKLAGLTTIPAIIVDAVDEDSAVLSLIENLQRENLNFFEEAEGYHSLLNDHKITQEELAKRLGKSQSTIANKLRLLKLSDKIKKLILEHNLTERHARALLRIPEEEIQEKVLKQIIEKNLNVKETEELIEGLLQKLTLKKEEKEQKRKLLKIYKDIRIFINTVKQAVNIMNKSGIGAELQQVDGEDYIEFVIKIPKYK